MKWLDRILAPVKTWTAVVLALAIGGALGWAWLHRGEVVLLPFEGADGAALSLRLGRALQDVALGSTTGIEVGPAALTLDGDGGPPAVSLPGTGVSFDWLVSLVQIGPLAETRVHGVCVQQGDTFQITLQVFGPAGARSVRSDVTADVDEALLQAAQGLYRVLDPAALSAYLFRRYPQRSLEVIHEVLADPHRRAADEATVYRIWGLVLLDQRDFDGAREKLTAALDRTPSRARGEQARIWIDLGNADLWQGNGPDAVGTYGRAARLDPRWAVPHNGIGDALAASGDTAAAGDEYREAIRLDPLSVDPLNSLARIYTTQQQYDRAIDAYTAATHRQLTRDRAAAFTYYGLGDVFFLTGCDTAAAAQYERAAAIEPLYEPARYDWALASACEDTRAPEPDPRAPWRPGPAAPLSADGGCNASAERHPPFTPPR